MFTKCSDVDLIISLHLNVIDLVRCRKACKWSNYIYSLVFKSRDLILEAYKSGCLYIPKDDHEQKVVKYTHAQLLHILKTRKWDYLTSRYEYSFTDNLLKSLGDNISIYKKYLSLRVLPPIIKVLEIAYKYDYPDTFIWAYEMFQKIPSTIIPILTLNKNNILVAVYEKCGRPEFENMSRIVWEKLSKVNLRNKYYKHFIAGNTALLSQVLELAATHGGIECMAYLWKKDKKSFIQAWRNVQIENEDIIIWLKRKRLNFNLLPFR